MAQNKEYLDRKELIKEEETFHHPENNKVKLSDQEESIQFHVSECMKFPVLGEYYDNLILKEAFERYEMILENRIHGVKGIGFRLEDGSIYDGEYELMTAGIISRDLIDLLPHYNESPLVQKVIIELEELLFGNAQKK